MGHWLPWKQPSQSRRCGTEPQCSYIVLGEVDHVLQVDVISVCSNVVVDEEVELVLDPVLENEGQDSGCKLQEEDNPQKHGELHRKG